jgi:hypothetical protein
MATGGNDSGEEVNFMGLFCDMKQHNNIFFASRADKLQAMM